MNVLLLLVLAQKTAFIEGTVAGTDGAGLLSKATVGIRYEKAPDGKGPLNSNNAKGNSTVTGEDGGFRLEAVEGVPFHFSLERDGYVSLGLDFGMGPAELRHTLIGDKSGVVVKMDAEGVLGGRLIDQETDQPIRGVTVVAHRRMEYAGAETWIADRRSKSDAEGRFRIRALPAGEYKIQVESSLTPKVVEGWKKDAAREMSYPALYFPGVSEFAGGSRVKVEKGVQLDYLDFRLRKEKRFRIRGEVKVDGATGKVRVASTTSTGHDGVTYRMIGSLAGSGRFEVENIPEGKFGLTFFSEGKDMAQRYQAVMERVMDEDVSDLEVRLEGGLKARFRVASFGDKTVDGDPLWTKEKPRFTVSLAPTRRFNFSSDQSHMVDSEAGVAIDGVFAEPLMLNLSGLPKGWVLRRLNYNGLEMDPFALKVDAGRPQHLFEALVSPVSNGIAGEVRLGTKPAEGVVVMAWREPIEAAPAARRMRSVFSETEGRYSIETLAPGAWHVVAVVGGDWQEGIKALRVGKGRRVELNENGVVRLQLEAVVR